MPLSASHIKFALDQVDYFKPNDLEKYFEGAIYPDSRFFSGLERTATHGDNFYSEEFWRDDDFKKGWASHNLSDRAYINGMKRIFPAWGNFSNDWEVIENNAVKIIGDIFVLERLDIKEKLDFINKISNPNNEKEEVLADHLRAVKNIYKNGNKTVIADHFEIKRKDYGDEIAKEIMAKAEFFYNDKNLSVAIKDFFNEGIKIEVEKILADMNLK